jgi:hypothetical protein
MTWKQTAAFDVLNRWAYLYRRNSWMLDPSRFWRNCTEVEIDRPIFLLGTQGGGLTLVSRMLRRHPQVVSITGDCRYWAGADEMQNVFEPVLPRSLTGLKYRVPADDLFTVPRGWVYATDRLLTAYRSTRNDVTPDVREQFLRLLRWNIMRNAKKQRGVRFIDKSQLFTVKVAYIDELLSGCSPKFVLITRNPYAMCYRSTDGTRSLGMLRSKLDFNQRLALAAQHWANSMACAHEDGRTVRSFMVVRFEDVLTDPERQLRSICRFAELEFTGDMLPRPDQKMPFGCLRRDRWYPLNTDVNSRYLRRISPDQVEIVARYCAPYADMLGYEKPGQ